MRDRAADVMRTLIDQIEFTPLGKGKKQIPAINLQGRLAGILAPASNEQKPPRGQDGIAEESIKLVAGVGFDWSRLALADGLMPGFRLQ